MSTTEQKFFKIALIGAGGVGKTAVMKRLKTGDYLKGYFPTIGVEIHTLQFHTNHGNVLFQVWDCAGQSEDEGLSEGYYISSDACIEMFDLRETETYRKGSRLLKNFLTICPDVPIVVCGNKVDEGREMSNSYARRRSEQRGYQYFDISAESCYQIRKPFLALAQQLTGYDDLFFKG